MKEITLCLKAVSRCRQIKLDVGKLGKSFEDRWCSHILISRGKNLTRNVSFGKFLQRLKKHLKSAVSNESNADFKLRALLKIFNQSIKEIACTPVANKLSRFHKPQLRL